MAPNLQNMNLTDITITQEAMGVHDINEIVKEVLP